MVLTSEINCNSTSDILLDAKLQIDCISAILNVSLPVHARSLAIRLISLGASESSGCDTPLQALAELEGVCKSTVIRMLKLLTQLNIFLRTEYRDKPCVYFFNPDVEVWTKYSTHDHKLKVVYSKSTESNNNTDYEEIVNNDSTSLFDEYVEVPDESLEVGNVAPTSNISIWRGDSERYWTTGPIYDEESGLWVQEQVESTGYTPQKVVIEAVKVAKGVRLLLAIASEVCGKVAAAVEKVLGSNQPQEDKTACIGDYRQQRKEQWYQELMTAGYTARKLSECNNDMVMLFCQSGGRTQSVLMSIPQLMREYPNPRKAFHEDVLTWEQGRLAYEGGCVLNG